MNFKTYKNQTLEHRVLTAHRQTEPAEQTRADKISGRVNVYH